MTLELAQAIAELGDYEVYEGYSGRGMYGQKTTGLVCACGAREILADIIEDMRTENILKDRLDEIDFFDVPREFREDSLGMKVIVY